MCNAIVQDRKKCKYFNEKGLRNVMHEKSVMKMWNHSCIMLSCMFFQSEKFRKLLGWKLSLQNSLVLCYLASSLIYESLSFEFMCFYVNSKLYFKTIYQSFGIHTTLGLIQEDTENMQHVLGSEFTSCLEYISLLFWWVLSFIKNINMKSSFWWCSKQLRECINTSWQISCGFVFSFFSC